jgi:hypothetical protein
MARGRAAGECPDAAYFRRLLREATNEGQRDEIIEHIEAAADAIGMVNVDHIGQAPSSSPEAREFFAQATGGRVPTLEHLDEWQTTCRTTEKTKDMAAAV